jgi:hypothetical protein
MAGSNAEKRLLGALIMAPNGLRSIESTVSADDFEDGRLGDVFGHVSQMIVTGAPVNTESVMNRMPEWNLKLEPTALFEWVNGQVMPHAITEYAGVVRSDSVRRSLRNVMASVGERVQSGEQPVDVASTAAAQLQKVVDGSSTGLLKTKTLNEILAGSDSYDWVVPDLLERRDRLVLTGAEGAGKTTFVRQLALLSASGIHPTTFQRIEPVRVLVVDAENTERQWRRAVRAVTERARAKGVADPGDVVNITSGNRIDITKGSHLGEIHRLIDRHKPDVVFIGPLYKLVPKAINSDDDAAPLIVGLDSLRERDVALVMEAHAGKGTSMDGERDLRPRGSAALLGWPEFGMGLRPVHEDPDMVAVVKWRGDRDERAWPKYLRRGGEWPWTPTKMPGEY